METRAADPAEIEPLARIWYDGWQDAHAAILPAELARHRTLASFAARLRAALTDVRVMGAPGQPVAFVMIRGDELYQLYVAGEARGSGVAASLLADAESRLAASGVATAWLACAIGNQRAARFYEKHGWQRVGNQISRLDTPAGKIPLEVWRYEKELAVDTHSADTRPLVAVAHVVIETDRMVDSGTFFRTIGMRPIFEGPDVSVYELRGATHLILMRREAVAGGDAAFDLMVDDLHGTHRQFQALGLEPSAIQAVPKIDHETFTVREPAGHVLTFYSSHASGKPV